MVTLEVSLKALAAVVSGVFALLVLFSGPRRTAHLALGVFLLLIAGNLTFDAVSSLLPLEDPLRLRLFRLGSVLAALDPVALYYFASLHPERNRLNQPWALSLVFLGGASLALTAPLAWYEGEGPPLRGFWNVALGVYTIAVYGIILAWSVRGLLRKPEDPTWRVLAPAMCVVALPLFPRVANVTASALTRANMGPGFGARELMLFETGVILLLATVLLLLVPWRRAAPPQRQAYLWGIGAAFVVTAFVRLYAFVLGLLGAIGTLEVLGRLGSPLRWLLFGALVSVALLRQPMLGLNLQSRRRAARLVLGLAFLATGLGALAFASVLLNEPLTLRPTEVLLLGGVVVLSQGFHRLVDAVAFRLYAVPPPGDQQARLEAYRTAVQHTLQEGGSEFALQRLARLRDELGIEPEVARALEMALEAREGGPLGVGQVVAGRYQLLELLGRGASGRVFLAQDRTLSRRVVVKEVPVDPPGAMETALAEARVAGGVHHAHVVTVHDALPRHSSLLLVTEHMAGGSLADRVHRDGQLPWTQGLPVLLDVLEGVAAVHRKGIVHRDLKPSNILLSAEGRAKIGDFGVARVHRPDETRVPGSPVGTPAYMAPEQLHGDVATPASDVYALGLVARRVLEGPLPDALEAVVERATRFDPAQRWPDAQAMLTALREASPRVQAQ